MEDIREVIVKMGRFFYICGVILVLIPVVACLSSCGDDEDSITNNETSNHTIVLVNGGTNTIECTARQFARVELAPIQNPSAIISKTFVSNPNTTIDIDLTIPQTDTYRISFHVADIDSSIWWDSIALEAGGSTNATLSTINMGFYPNSYVAGIRSSGNDIPCD